MYWRISPRHITCRQFNEFVVDYLDGNLSEKETERFERHMIVCPMCRLFLERYKIARDAGVRVIADDPSAPVPDGVPGDLIDAILDSRDR
ncbi:MAG: zf-HC2 domain-containing protein [Pseudomonadota bacterium]